MGIIFIWFVALCTGIPGLIFLAVGADRHFDKKGEDANALLAIGLALIVIAVYCVISSIQFWNMCQTNPPGCG